MTIELWNKTNWDTLMLDVCGKTKSLLIRRSKLIAVAYNLHFNLRPLMWEGKSLIWYTYTDSRLFRTLDSHTILPQILSSIKRYFLQRTHHNIIFVNSPIALYCSYSKLVGCDSRFLRLSPIRDTEKYDDTNVNLNLSVVLRK